MTPSEPGPPRGLGEPGEEQELGDLETDFHYSELGREINERIEARAALVNAGEKMCLVCECGDGDCKAQIEMTPEQYHSVRQNVRTFAVTQGHESPTAERILDRADSWVLVEKLHQARTVGVMLIDVQPEWGNTTTKLFKGA